MIRNIVIWLMDLYSDNGRPIPTWLQRRIDADPMLSEHAMRTARLEQQLRVSARERLGGIAAEQNLVQPQVTRSDRPSSGRSTIGWLTLAASLLIVIAGGVVVTRNATWWNAKPQGLDVTANEPAGDSQPAANQPMPTADHDLQKAKLQWRAGALAAKNWVDRSLRKSETAPAVAMNLIDNEFSQELLKIRHHVGDATRFFAVKLPLAGSKLLGAIP